MNDERTQQLGKTRNSNSNAECTGSFTCSPIAGQSEIIRDRADIRYGPIRRYCLPRGGVTHLTVTVAVCHGQSMSRARVIGRMCVAPSFASMAVEGRVCRRFVRP